MPTLNAILVLRDERHCKSQQVKSSLAALNCGPTTTQNQVNSGGTYSTPYQQQVSPPPLSGQPSTVKASSAGEMVLYTDDQIHAFIARRLAYYRTIPTQKKQTHSNKGGNFCTNDLALQSDCINSNSVSHLPTTSASHKEDVERQSLNCAVIEQCTAAVGQALEEDSSKGSKANAQLTPKSKETGDCAKSASEKHSTEYPQIMMNVSATCTKNEESPVVFITLPGITLDELTEKHPSLTLNCSASQEECKSLGLNINKTLDDKDQVPGVSWALKNMTQKDKGDAGLKPVEAVGLDNVQGVTDVSEDLQTKSSPVVSENKTFEYQDANTKKKKNIEDQQHCGVTCKEVIAHSKISSSIDKIQIHNVSRPTNQIEWLCKQTSHEGAGEDVAYVRSQTDLSIELNENEVREHAPLSESKGEEGHAGNILKEPQYEDISDDEDVSQLATKPLNTEHEEFSFTASSQEPLYEDISEYENPQIENMAVEKLSLTQVPEPNNKQSPFENEGYRHVQGQAQMKTETNRSVSCIPSSVLEDEDESDDQMDDDWIVIPISMSDLKFEPEDEDQDGTEKVVLGDGETGDKERRCDTNPTHCELHWPAPKPGAASASSQMEVFDTVESFLQAKGGQFKNKAASGWSTPEHEMDCEREPHTTLNRRESNSEPEDSCETEDSCDYSSGSEHNYLTVSRHLLKKSSAPLAPETDDTASEKEGEGDDEVRNVHKGQTRSLDKLGCMQKLRQLVETRARSKQKISKNDDIIIIDSDTEDENDQNGNRLFSSGSEDSGDARCIKKTGQLIEGKCGSEHVQHKTNKQIMSEERIVFHDSDKVVKKDHFSKKKANTKRIHSSGSEDSDDALFGTKNRPSTEDQLCGTANKKAKKPRLLSEDSPKKEPPSVDKETESSLGPNPVIPRFIVLKSSPPNHKLKLLKESRVHMQGKDETCAPKTPTATSEKTDSCETNTPHLHKNKNGGLVSKPKPANDRHHATKNKVHSNIAKHRLVSRQLSLPNQDGPSNSISSSSSISGQLSEARQSSASSRGLSQSGETSASSILPKSKQSTSIPRHLPPSKLQRSHSYSNPSTLDHPHSLTTSATMQSSARDKVNKDWKKDYVPTRRDRKSSLGMEEDFRTGIDDSRREARPRRSHYNRAPRRSHNSHKSATPLMKKTKSDAVQWTKAINRDTLRTGP